MHASSRFVFATTTCLALICSSLPANAIDPTVSGTGTTAPITTSASEASAGTTASTNTGNRSGGILSGIFGCGADGNKQTIGAVAGGVLGGFLGNRVAGHGSRTIGTVLGGAIGAAAGSWLGCKLQTSDREKAAHATDEAIKTGKDQTWASDETGASGKVEVASTAPGLADIKLASGVEPAAGYNKVGGSFISTANANIRSAPGMQGKILGQLTIGQRVWVPASVQNAPWLLISDNGVGQGYVSNALLKQDSTATAANCKLVKQTVSVPGAADESETLQACKDANGQWTMTRV